MEAFKDITIIGVDKDRVNKPNPEKEMYEVYFELSEVPPSEWIGFFDEGRRIPLHSKWRKAWIEGKYVVVYCCLDEVELHQRGLNENVAKSNKKYQDFL